MYSYQNNVNDIIARLESLCEQRFAFYDNIVRHDTEHHNIMATEWSITEIKRHLDRHISDKETFTGFSFHRYPEPSRTTLLKCSCGWNRPIDHGIYEVKMYGVPFYLFVEEINWAYGLILDKTEDVDLPSSKEIPCLIENIKRKFSNPIANLEV